MKLTNGDIFTAKEPLQVLLEQRFPVRTAYGLAKLSSKLNEQLKVIDKVRNGLINQYGVKDDKGGMSVKPDSPDWEKFAGEFNELMAQEVEVVIEKVKLPERVAATCDACHHNMDRLLEIEPKILLQLEKFIEVS